jgi:hypothetical protein
MLQVKEVVLSEDQMIEDEVGLGSCVTSIAGPNFAAQLYER